MRHRFAVVIVSTALLFATAGSGRAFSVSELFGGGKKQTQQHTTGTSQQQRQAEFLNRVRRSDPNRRTIQKAVFNENNELGIILGHKVEMDTIPRLMKGLLIQEAKFFPGQDLTIIAYAPSNPPVKIGTAHLNARTRDMTYTPARR